MREPRMVMVDLETMSTRSNAVISSIGAVKFNANTGEIDPNTFYQTVDYKDCKRLGMHTSSDTVRWWKGNPEVLKMLTINTVSVTEALTKFAEWFGPKSMPLWGCGSDFDCVILRNAYIAADLEHLCPWKYYHNRCYRTMRDTLEFQEPKREGTYHNALDDAMHQTKVLLKILGS